APLGVSPALDGSGASSPEGEGGGLPYYRGAPPRKREPKTWPMTSSRPSAKPVRRRLLVRGVNWLGDAVMTTPALQRLREALPDSHITLLTHQKLSGL